MVEHTGKHSARSARGRRNDDSPGGVLLAYGQRVGEHQTPALQVVAVAVGLHIVSLCLAPQIQRSRQSSLLIDAAFHGVLHSLPDFRQKSVYLLPLALLHVFPVASACALAVLLYVRHGVHLVNLPALGVAHFLVFQGASSYRKYRPLVLG